MPEQEPAPLLLCLDLEAGSEALARQAAELARRCRRPVRILHVSDGHPAAEERKGIEAALARICEEMLAGIEITGVEIRQGLPEETIVEAAGECDATMILLGRRQRSAVERIYVGSTTSAVISLARRPVLVVPVAQRP